ncbi:hypothetical protein Salpa_2188 [Sporomusa sp. KB1]|nr:hypothetical protein Salpa_2188 [Sporomusa sp. KB1]
MCHRDIVIWIGKLRKYLILMMITQKKFPVSYALQSIFATRKFHVCPTASLVVYAPQGSFVTPAFRVCLSASLVEGVSLDLAYLSKTSSYEPYPVILAGY